jgi:hypothetical protein
MKKVALLFLCVGLCFSISKANARELTKEQVSKSLAAVRFNKAEQSSAVPTSKLLIEAWLVQDAPKTQGHFNVNLARDLGDDKAYLIRSVSDVFMVTLNGKTYTYVENDSGDFPYKGPNLIPYVEGATYTATLTRASGEKIITHMVAPKSIEIQMPFEGQFFDRSDEVDFSWSPGFPKEASGWTGELVATDCPNTTLMKFVTISDKKLHGVIPAGTISDKNGFGGACHDFLFAFITFQFVMEFDAENNGGFFGAELFSNRLFRYSPQY